MSLDLFGGEPTLEWEYVVDVLSKIKQICDMNKVFLFTTITSNGYLLDEHKVLDLLPFNFTYAQITLDGTKPFHDLKRITKDKQPTFDVIINNLHTLLRVSDDVQIGIRVNCDDENITSIPLFVEYIFNELGNKRVSIMYCYAKYEVDNDERSIPGEYNGMTESDFINELPSLYNESKKFGFFTPDYYHINGLCVAKSKHSIILHPSGYVYKCPAHIGKKEYQVGNIFETKFFDNFFDEKKYKGCMLKKCIFIPLCHTGCIISHNNTLEAPCKKNMLEKINKMHISGNLRII